MVGEQPLQAARPEPLARRDGSQCQVGIGKMRIDVGLDRSELRGAQPAAAGKRCPVKGGANRERRKVVHVGDDGTLQFVCR